MRINRAMKIAEWIIKEGTSETTNGNYIFYSDDICYMFNVNQKYLQKHYSEIIDFLKGEPQITKDDGIWIGFDGKGRFESIDCNFYLCYCPKVDRLVYDYD